MTTPQQPEQGDASPEKPVGESEPLEPSGTAWAAPASSGPWESHAVEPDAPDSSAKPGAQTPTQRDAAETAPDLGGQPRPSSAAPGDSAPAFGVPPEWARPELWDDPSARYDQDQPGTVYPPINDTAPEPTYGGYPTYTPQPYTPPGPQSGAQTLSIIGFVCAGISLLFCPYLFGPVGIILGIIGHRKGESLGKWAAIASAISLIVGLILVYAVFSGSLVPDSD
ncbi:hypothetical protein AB0L63_02290 [Nocardia sp. NPDC051990]|uniref:hypothetical protein n=1 Tax=Nocardia sp. NPDC051990 TaxID=3155285 RepID=UPI00341EBA81